jgi:hypothetical protein
MTVDSDIQIWLETQGRSGQEVITPYVRSARTEQLQYQMEVFLNTSSGSSITKQGGTVDVSPRKPSPMGHVSLRYTAADSCIIRIRLQDGEEWVGNYKFDCPSR